MKRVRQEAFFPEFPDVWITGTDRNALSAEELAVLRQQARYCQAMVDADRGILEEILVPALAGKLGDKGGIARYGSAYVPMDEALSFCALDISGRPFLAFNAQFTDFRCGNFDTCLTEEFWRAFAMNSGITL